MAQRIGLRTLTGNPLALIVVGFFAWRYRFQIQEKLEAMGVKTPWMGQDMGEAVQSGAAKISGKLKRGFSDDRSASI